MKRLVGILVLAMAVHAFGGFASSEIFLPDVGKVAGLNQSQFFTTVWVTNLGSSAANFTFELLLAGQANGSPASFSDTLAPGETKMYADVIDQTFHLASANGGARIVASSGELFVSERIYNQPSGAPLSQSAGQFYSGIPKDFSIGSGESASLQGVYIGSGQDFRYNYILLETSGHSCNVHVQALDDAGAQLGASDVPLKPYEQLLLSANQLAPGASSTNARITATVTTGSGSVILAGSQVGNGGPQDQSGFEMSFKDSLLTGSGGAGVTSLNALTGALTLAAGTGISVTPAGSTITIAYTGGGSSGITSVTHDATMVGLGTGSSPIGVAAPLALTTSDGNVITANSIATSGSQAGVLGISASPSGFGIHGHGGNNNTDGYLGGNDYGVFGIATDNSGTGVMGQAAGSNAQGVSGTNSFRGTSGVLGSSNVGVLADATNTGDMGVFGSSADGDGIFGSSSSNSNIYAGVHGHGHNIGVLAVTGGPSYTPFPAAVFAVAQSGDGVYGKAGSGSIGVLGVTDSFFGVEGISGSSDGVHGESSSGDGVRGTTSGGGHAGVHGQHNDSGGSFAGVEGENTTHGNIGYLGGPDYAVFGHGSIVTDGAKDFVEPHPTDPSKQILYVCLEGPESGTYFRGTGRIVNGFATIEIPDHFRMVTAEKGLTVVATPVGGLAVLAAVHQGLDKIVIQGSSDVEFNYLVNGVRKAFEDHQPIVANTFFVPRSEGDSRFGKGLPAESVRRLKANGILNQDGSINQETAHRLGWDQRPGWNDGDKSR